MQLVQWRLPYTTIPAIYSGRTSRELYVSTEALAKVCGMSEEQVHAFRTANTDKVDPKQLDDLPVVVTQLLKRLYGEGLHDDTWVWELKDIMCFPFCLSYEERVTDRMFGLHAACTDVLLCKTTLQNGVLVGQKLQHTLGEA